MAYIRAQNPNQLVPTPLLGSVSLINNPDIKTVKLLATSTAYFQAGQAVKLVSGADPEIVVDAVTGATDGPVYGVIIYNPRSAKPTKGQRAEIACRGSALWMEASAAITRGQGVAAAVPGVSGTTDPQVTADSTTAHYITGTALTEATAEGQLVLVEITPSKNP